MATGYELKRLRTKAGKSAAEIADLIGVDTERLRKWEQRDTDPKDGIDVQKIEIYFGMAISELDKLDNFQFIKKTSNLASEADKEKELLYELKEALKDNTLMVDYRKDLLARLIRMEANQEVIGQRIDQVLSILLNVDLEKVLSASENDIKLARQDLLNQLESTARKSR